MRLNSKAYIIFAVGLFLVFILTLFLNNFVSEERHAMSKMQHDWTQEEHHLMDELRESMAEIKTMLDNEKVRRKRDASTRTNNLNDEVRKIVKEVMKEASKSGVVKSSRKDKSSSLHIDESPKLVREEAQIPETKYAEPEKLDAIRAEFLHAWKAYEQYGWGMDVVKPVSRRGENEQYRMGITLLDSLDTMLIMGLDETFKRALEWVKTGCHFDNQEVSVFETTIRGLGGLLAAYHLSGEQVLLDKALELATKMEPAFNTKTGFPRSTVNLATGRAWCPSWARNSASFSEVTSLYLEWTYLARLTNTPRFQERMDKILDTMINMNKIKGLYAQWVNVETARFTMGDVTLGSRVDSAYEYLEKIYRFTNRTRPRVFKEYLDRIDSVEQELIKHSTPNGFTYIQQCSFDMNRCHGQFDHLVCFAPAMYALGAQEKENPNGELHMQRAKELTDTCYESYKRMPTGLAPEIIKFGRGEDFYVEKNDEHNLLRPETVESIFVMWRLTHDQKYRDMGWAIFESFRKWTKVPGSGYSSIVSVKISDASFRKWKDKTESFFFAETLKYLYLLFTEDSVLPIDKYVFNTEAHAFPMP